MIVDIPYETQRLLMGYAISTFNDKEPYQNAKVDPNRDDLRIQFDGLRTEYSVHQILKIPFVWELKKHGDGGITDLVYRNRTFQCKYRYYNGKNTVVYYNHKTLNADGRCGCCGIKVKPSNVFLADYTVWGQKVGNDAYKCKIMGYIDRNTFLANCTTTNFGYGLRFCIPSTMLRPIEKLDAELDELDKLNKLNT